MWRVETLEDKSTWVGRFERGDSLTGSINEMEERIECLDNSQKVVVQMVDVKPALDMVRDKVVDFEYPTKPRHESGGEPNLNKGVQSSLGFEMPRL